MANSQDASEENRTLLSKPTPVGRVQTIKDLGLVFNHNIGSSNLPTFRVSVTVLYNCTVDESLAILRRNFERELSDPYNNHILRMRVRGTQFWYTDIPAAQLFDELVHVGEASKGKVLRRGDKRDQVSPVAYCFVEVGDAHEGGETVTRNSWFFRHDLVDGFRVCQQILPISFSKSEMVTKRLAARYNASQKKPRPSAGEQISSACAMIPACLLGCLPTCYNFSKVCCSRPRYRKSALTERMYLHAVCSLSQLRDISRAQGAPSLNGFINATFVHAYFAADRSANSATFAINCVSNFTKKTGNGTCIRVCEVERDDDRSVAETSRLLAEQTSSMSNNLIYLFTRCFAQNYSLFPNWFRDWFGNRHDSFDFLVSNIPAFEVGAEPRILKYETVRESIDWKPNIAFAVGCEDLLTFDLFFGAIPPHFDQQRFRAKFCEIVNATESHTEYPRYY